MTSSLLASALVVLLLGTGYPRPDPEHAGPSTAIVIGDKWFVVDAGRGATLRIAATDLKYANLRAVFLTHLHSDHTAGLPDLFNTSWQFGRKTVPLELYGPPGTRKLSKAMLDFFAEDIHLRRDLLEKHPAAGATIRTHIVREGVVYDDGEVKVTAFAVDHKPVKHAFGYRFDARGESVVISGDTRPAANLVRYAKGADVLVLEAYLPEHFLKVDTPEVAARLMSYHTSAEEAGAIAAEARVKTLVLTHLIPANAEETFRERAARKFGGKIIVGRDLLRVPAQRGEGGRRPDEGRPSP
ncbi:MAG TPA: MBL fold metallo-hydrolase [Thermoanaerobaculia bacterium]|nr:MBL fold metallo-hydrolase [Thermoanaerobaculia bacterium]